LFAALTAMGADRPGVALAGGDQGALESLFAHWQARRGDISTAQLTYRSFHNAVEGKRTPAELEGFLDSGLLNRTAGSFREFIAAMNGGPFRIDPPWGEGRITIRDAQRRSDLGPFTSIQDREICVDFDSLNTQFDVAAGGGSRQRSDDLTMFRPLPPEPWTAERWRVVERTPANVKLVRIHSSPGVEPEVLDDRTWECDPQTGLVTRIVRLDARGEVLSLARYLEPVELSDAVAVPQVFVEAIFRERVATVLHVCAIDTISVNDPIPDSAFQLAASANSRIVDYRGPRKLVSQLDQKQTDIIQWLKDHAPIAAQFARKPPPADHTLRNVLLIGNGLFFIVLGLVVWKGQRMTRRLKEPISKQTSGRRQPPVQAAT
jgi:hypothetical protein